MRNDKISCCVFHVAHGGNVLFGTDGSWAAYNTMPPFLFRCPITGYRVQGFTAEEVSDDDYQQISCNACQQTHYVNPKTGKVLGGDDQE